MTEGRRVFLTGATGFIGGRLARRLAERGDRLRCLVRETSDTTDLERIGAELIVGDATDDDALDRGLDGADLAYHLAGIYDVGVVDEDELRRVNVDGTRAFLAAAERSGTPRSIYVSTTAVLAPASPGGEADETTPLPDGWSFRTAYQRTKRAAHEAAHEAIQRGLPLIIACPAFVYGPGDPGPGARFIEDLLRRRVPGLTTGPGWFSYVHVDDVVRGLERAGDDGELGAVYIFSGEHGSINDFARRAAEAGGTRAPRLRFPVPLARLTGRILDPVSRATGRTFPLSRENVDLTSRHHWVHSSERARQELGWRPRPLDEGLPETVAWVRRRIDHGR